MVAICNVPVALRATAKRTVAKRGMSVKAAAGPQHWLPGTEPPAYLDGTMAGDYGFDPLRLGQNPETLPYLQEAELMNGRWAMHATAGILFTDAVGLPKFWEAGEAALGAHWLQFSVTGACTLYNMQDLLEGETGTTFTCPSLVSSDSSYTMSLYDGTVDSFKDFHANWTLTLPGGSMTIEGVGMSKAQHGIDDIVSGMATVGGRIRDATGDYYREPKG